MFLTELELSDFRRIGATLVIALPPEPGATILVAPNGTGKTSIFEAIELALTGAVRRLGDATETLIREGRPAAKVRAQYGEAHVTVSVVRGAQHPIKQDGDPAAILGAAAGVEVATLLRLTHLMDQDERGWFVRASREAGGGKLAALPAVRDTLAASGALSKTRQALSTFLKEADDAKQKAQDSVREWRRLIGARDDARRELETERPLMEAGALRRSSSDLASSPWGDPTAVGSDPTPAALQAAASVLDKRLVNFVHELDHRRVALESLDGLVEHFEALLQEEGGAKAILDASLTSRGASLEARDKARETLRNTEEKLHAMPAGRRAGKSGP